MFKVRVEGIQSLVKRYTNAEPVTRRAFLDELGKLGHFTRELCKDEVQDIRYTGAFEQSFSVAIGHHDLSAKIYPKASHSMFIRTGTRPHWPPSGPIKAWAAAKLGDEKLWFLVARSIAEHGTSVYQERKRGTKANPWPERVVARRDFQAALKKSSKTIGTQIIARIYQGQ